MLHGGNVWQSASPSDWLDYSANLRPEGMADWTRECFARGVERARYYPDLGMSAARSSLSEFAGVAPECLLPTAGGIAAIDLACALAPGRVLIMPPTFGEYARRARAQGRDVAVYVGEGSRAWGDMAGCLCFGPCADALRAGDTLFLCNPDNPSGETLKRGEVLALAGLAARRGARLVVDEAFIDYCPEHSVRVEAAGGVLPLTVVASLTKILGVPGARLGYLVADADYVRAAQAQALPWALNSCAAEIAAQVDKHAADIAADGALNTGRRERLARALRALGVDVMPSGANFLLVRLDVPARRVAQELKRAGILTRDCASFGALDEHYMRLAVKTDAENERLTREMDRALAALSRAL